MPTAIELLQQAEDIRTAAADIVWVGLGTPKQDRWSADPCAQLPVVAVVVGAAFDFIAGTKPQAPLYLFGNARFLWGLARQTTRGGGTAGALAATGK